MLFDNGDSPNWPKMVFRWGYRATKKGNLTGRRATEWGREVRWRRRWGFRPGYFLELCGSGWRKRLKFASRGANSCVESGSIWLWLKHCALREILENPAAWLKPALIQKLILSLRSYAACSWPVVSATMSRLGRVSGPAVPGLTALSGWPRLTGVWPCGVFPRNGPPGRWSFPECEP